MTHLDTNKLTPQTQSTSQENEMMLLPRSLYRTVETKATLLSDLAKSARQALKDNDEGKYKEILDLEKELWKSPSRYTGKDQHYIETFNPQVKQTTTK